MATNVFQTSLLESLEKRHEQGRFISLPSPSIQATANDFGSNDFLSISSGPLREEFLSELERHPGFTVGSKGSRILDGTTQYLIDLEKHIANHHNAEDALFFNSGYDANVGIYSTLPQPGDVVIYDELIHASVHDGLRHTRASATFAFKHNDAASLEQVLQHVKVSFAAIADGKRSVLIALESIYSMDGDTCPIHELLAVTKGALPRGNGILIMDEAHSNGVIGPNGSGFVCYHSLESEFQIRLHTFGKALGSTGAAVLCSRVVKDTLVNYARNFIFTTAPTFPTLAAVKAGYNILASPDGAERRCRMQQMISFFHMTLERHPTWKALQGNTELRVVGREGWESRPFHTPIIPVVTGRGHCRSLAAKMLDSGFLAHAVQHPIVPLDAERVRIVIHADNTQDQVKQMVDTMMQWAGLQYLTRPRL